MKKNHEKLEKNHEKTLAQEVHQKSDISECRTLLGTWPGHCATVRRHLTPKKNITFFIRN